MEGECEIDMERDECGETLGRKDNGPCKQSITQNLRSLGTSEFTGQMRATKQI